MDWRVLTKDVRHPLGLKQEALAYALNVSQTAISRWERGKATPNPHVKRWFINQNRILHGIDEITYTNMAPVFVGIYDRDLTIQAASYPIYERYPCAPKIGDKTGSSEVSFEGRLNAVGAILTSGLFDGERVAVRSFIRAKRDDRCYKCFATPVLVRGEIMCREQYAEISEQVYLSKNSIEIIHLGN